MSTSQRKMVAGVDLGGSSRGQEHTHRVPAAGVRRHRLIPVIATRPAAGAQWDRGCSSSVGLRSVIGCFLVFWRTKNAIVPHTAGTQREIAW